MPAQNGTAVLLDYGTQGARQAGQAVLLEYTPTIVPRVMLSSGVTARWPGSRAAASATRLTAPRTVRLDEARREPWAFGPARNVERLAPWVIGRRADSGRRVPWRPRERRIDDQVVMPWGRARLADDGLRAPWRPRELRIDDLVGMPWVGSAARDLGRVAPWGLPRSVDPLPLHAVLPRVRSADLPQWMPWTRYSRILDPGWGVAQPPGPTPNPDGTWVVPVKQVYIMLNESTLTRVSDGAVVPTMGLSLSLDAERWTWNWSATVPHAAIALVGRGTELQAAVNGDVVRLVVEAVARSRTFGRDSLRVSGRGRNAELGEPSSQVLSHGNLTSTRTAQQLAYDALLDNGVPLPWSIDWQLTDWTVPAGAWALQGTRMAALQAIAAAAGGYVQPHNSDQVVRLLHRYPIAPWDWAGVTPDIELPAAGVTSEGIEWITQPAYNRVFVSGEGDGVLGQITRTGTAGDMAAPTVTDALATHSAVVLQRGRAVLSDTGDQALVTLKMPVWEETGVIVPGKFVRYVDGATTRVGIVRSTQVEVGYVEAWQTIKVETHE